MLTIRRALILQAEPGVRFSGLAASVKCVYTIGAAADKIQSQIRGTTEIIPAGTIEAAIKRASASAIAGDIVLLAPACASFDQFQNYEHRGRVFKELVGNLVATPNA